MRKWLILLTLPASIALTAPALAQNSNHSELIQQQLYELTGQHRIQESWPEFYRTAEEWIENDSKIMVVLEDGRLDYAGVLIRNLLEQKLALVLDRPSGHPLWVLAGLYLGSERMHQSELPEFRARFAPIRHYLSDQYYRDAQTNLYIKIHFKSILDWGYLSTRFAQLPLEDQMKLFIPALLEGEDDPYAPDAEQLQKMWDVLSPQLQTRPARMQWARMFDELAYWADPVMTGAHSLSHYTRTRTKLAWVYGPIAQSFLATSYQGTKLRLFARLDPISEAAKRSSLVAETKGYAEFFGREENLDLVRDYFTALMKETKHPLTAELDDPEFRRFIQHLDFNRVFANHPEMKKQILPDLLESLLAQVPTIQASVAKLQLWDRVMAAYLSTLSGSAAETTLLKRVWPVYFKNVREFDFTSTAIDDGDELARIKIQHLQHVARIELQHPELFTQYDPAGEDAAIKDLYGSDVPEGLSSNDILSFADLDDLCNSRLHDQN